MTENQAMTPLLDVTDLDVTFTTAAGVVNAVKGANLTVYPGQTVAIVGESGSGKSTTAHAVINLLPGTGKVTGGSIKFDGEELTTASKKRIVELRGRDIGLVPQDPMSNLNPVWSIGFQIKETLKANNVDVSRTAISKLEAGLDAAESEFIIGSKSLKLLKAELGDKAALIDGKIVAGATSKSGVIKALSAVGVPNADALAAKYVTGATKNDRVAGLLAEAGLADAARRAKQYPHEFSGGMRQRALIAIGLAARPKLLIADEPTSALDVTVQRQILDHLEGLTQEFGTAVLFITHDLGLAAERAEHLVVMFRGEVVESGPALEILRNPQHPYTQKLVKAAPSLASRRIQSAKAAGVEATDLLAPTAGHGVDEARPNVIEVERLSKVFHIRGQKGDAKNFKAVDHVSFALQQGTTLAIVGESGSGKSTVANMVLNLLEPTEGVIKFDGRDLAGLSAQELFKFRRRVQPIFQNPYGSLDPMYSIFRILEEPLRVHNIGSKTERRQRVKDVLEMVAMPESTMRRYPNELSGGQRQRIAIARALALSPEVIVCDEAVSALDVLVQAQVLELLNDLQAELGLSYLFITHDLAVVRQIADEVIVMEKGKIVEHASTDEVFDSPSAEYTRQLLEAIPGGSIELGV
ncbi:ABC transporter ATP-binding protein [Jonesiaceae bacterium BS-20]|uniref:ABC transporter ATP-binding protein n=1 Tax=Jonesiaceae bacterium BS-20 TaxID=3120821 RepID=A0AAU7DZ91_9MICO